MRSITMLCVGKLKESYWREACAEYCKRLGAFCRITVTEVEEERLPVNPSTAQIKAGIECEGKRLETFIPQGALVVALCIEGKLFSSEGLCAALDNAAVCGKSSAVFIIGGSYGLWEQLKHRADIRLSMSHMTFPHQLARVMLLEQIYRAYQISSNGKYHK